MDLLLTCLEAVVRCEFALDQKPKVLGTKLSTCPWPTNVYAEIISENDSIMPGAVVVLVLTTKNVLPCWLPLTIRLVATLLKPNSGLSTAFAVELRLRYL